ncbi:helix-turn-helix domain-containing protein [Seleniivibrio sp.]|uniref:winged helix-turn-helix transcriptional regulator n=1 Tax=Seleniivibrio sp. TaxID=2898801 RepID=UPI0025E88DB5|nr:helix-turn-helix domain-containing protein [Seleniivibrio sp.]MCD8553317.1 helix-turn-helix transcriptional regulator [Seleniivibrio sp.]
MKKDMPACPVEVTLMLMGDKWKILIIRDLLEGTKRFGELKKSVSGISQKMLTANLRAMEECMLVDRKVYAEVPPKVEYTLTETGYSLKTVLDSMAEWGESYKRQAMVQSSAF